MKERVVGLESEHWLWHLLFSLGISNCKVLTLLPIIRPAPLISVTLIIYYLLFNSIPEDFAGLGWQCLIFCRNNFRAVSPMYFSSEDITDMILISDVFSCGYVSKSPNTRCHNTYVIWKRVLFFTGILVGFFEEL